MEDSQVHLVRDQLAKLSAHPSFSNKDRLRAFLDFVVTNTLSGDVSRLKETLIGVEVYHRNPSYNPKESPIVRTEARRLRRLLDEYYAGDGSADPVLVQVPKGAYVARFEFRKAPIDLPEGSAQPEMPPHSAPVPVRQKPKWFGTPTWLKFVTGLLSACLLATAALTLMNAPRRTAVWSAKPFARLGGIQEFSAFSPDGRRLAYVWSGPKGENRDIYVQDLKADFPKRLTTDAAEDTRPAWSPDGKKIAFIRLLGGGRKELDLISLETGKETKLADLEGATPWLCIIPRLSWSEDGRYLFTSESFGADEACGVVAIDVKTRDLRRVTRPPAGSVGDLEPAVSPDGKQIAFLRNAGTMGGDIYSVGVGGGPVQRITFDNRDIMGFCWSADGNSLIVASRRGDGVVKLWRMFLERRQAQQLTDGAALAAFPSTSPLGDRIAFTSYRNATGIWRMTEKGVTSLISDQSGNSNPQLSPDGKRLLYRSDRTGAFEIWISERDGRNSIRLTHFNGPMVNNPSWSPDGKQIAFECRSLGHSDICLISADGHGDAYRVTQWSSNQILPSWSRDGRSIYFSSNYSGRWNIYKQAVAGGDPIAITQDGGMRAVESWDGRFVYVHRGEPLGGIVRIPVKERSSDSSVDDVESEVFLSGLTGGTWGDWDAGPSGIVFLTRTASGKVERILQFDPETGLCRDLSSVEGNSPEGDRIFSIEPTGNSFLYVKTQISGSELGILERRYQ